ncbi:MAG: DUF4124 domain-containing protein [Gammaproteobacteria bacterium]|nr:DUF4124 domain-containing protein [Gammaproteobacteria bacterium]
MAIKPLITASHIRPILIGLICSMPVSPIQAATLYKWIDDEGNIRYSDRMPITDVKKQHQTLNDQGIVIDTKAAAKTEEELDAEAAAKKAEELRLAEEKRLKTIQDKKDRVLLLTFSSEQEMSSVHGNRIDVIDSVINLIKKSLTTTEERLIGLEDKADLHYRSKDKEIPGGLAQNIEHFTRKVLNRKEQLRLKEEEKQKINKQFELDLARYRLLKTQKSN